MPHQEAGEEAEAEAGQEAKEKEEQQEPQAQEHQANLIETKVIQSVTIAMEWDIGKLTVSTILKVQITKDQGTPTDFLLVQVEITEETEVVEVVSKETTEMEIIKATKIGKGTISVME